MASEADMETGLQGSTIVVAIIVPVVFVVIILFLIVAAFIFPRFARDGDGFTAIKEERMRHRLEEINKVIKTQNFDEWRSSLEDKESKSLPGADPICAICLDDFNENAQIRGLRCSHAFHVHCLDAWFARFNEFCPLCHRTIIPGKKVARNTMYPVSQTMPLAYIV